MYARWLFNKKTETIKKSREISLWIYQNFKIKTMEMIIKWGGKDYNLTSLQETQTFKDLKEEIYKQTNVKPERQKILGLKTNSGQNPEDATILTDLK